MPMIPEQFTTETENACKGLTYISESDAEVHAYTAPRPFKGESLVPVWFRASAQLPPLIAIEQRDYNELIARQSEHDGAWTVLDDIIASNTTQTTVFAVGDSAQKDIYIVGIIDGLVAGARTYTVET